MVRSIFSIGLTIILFTISCPAHATSNFSIFNAIEGFKNGQPDLNQTAGLKPIRLIYWWDLFGLNQAPYKSPQDLTPDVLSRVHTYAQQLSSQLAPGAVVCIDIEDWPLTEGDAQDILGSGSVSDSGAPNPAISDDQMPAIINRSIQNYITVLAIFKQEAPGFLYGYYSELPLWAAQASIKGPNDPKYLAWHTDNDRLLPIAAQIDVFFPSLYNEFGNDLPTWQKYAAEFLAEAHRFNTELGTAKPIYVFLLPEYHPTTGLLPNTPAGEPGNFLTHDFWAGCLQALQNDGADGAVFWDTNNGWRADLPWSNQWGWWQATLEFLGNLTQAAVQSLRQLADAITAHPPILIGSAVDLDVLQDPQATGYRNVLSREFNTVVPGNAMKFEELQPSEGNWDFTVADKLMQYALDNGMKVKGHTLAWRDALPNWVTQAQDNWDSDKAKQVLRDHVQNVIQHFARWTTGGFDQPGEPLLIAFDVVNESLFNAQDFNRSLVWAKIQCDQTDIALGCKPGLTIHAVGRRISPKQPGGGQPLPDADLVIPDYIQLAFLWARSFDPRGSNQSQRIKLIYNDFDGEFWGDPQTQPKNQMIYQLVKVLKENGLPLDGVGLQTHLNTSADPTLNSSSSSYPFNYSALGENLRQLAALDLDVQITEMDVRYRDDDINTVVPAAAQLLDRRREIYQNVLQQCLGVSRCTSFIMWGFTDLHPDFPGQSPHIFDESYEPKPEYFGLVDALSATH